MIAFGPVPSRRLGRSLGINNIPPKVCTYACVYCQVGRTTEMTIDRRPFYDPGEIAQDVQEKVDKSKEAGEPIDYLTFVPDGEPTLDANLGHEIDLLKPLGIPIAVITNNSLLSRQDVREDLMAADWVSLKVDSVEERIWRRVNRPYGRLKLASILEGALAFARSFRGKLVTETMLVAGVNDGDEHLGEAAGFLGRLCPDTAYLAIPTRPPTEKWVRPPDEGTLNRAYQILSEKVGQVEYLIGYEGDTFAYTGDVEQELLSITAVHPMREDAVVTFLARAGAKWEPVHRLTAEGQLAKAEYEGHAFYLRRLRAPTGENAQ
jgi:wyosine [tRNA(Phe)-imidazoG37] synthetase (radical SAM superfamily)